MMYYIDREGQQYGPYSEDAVRQYLKEGSLLGSDQVRTDASQSWRSLSQVFPVATPVAPQVVPPALHWALVLLLDFTLVFIYIWPLVQSTWVKKINPRSKATVMYVIWAVCAIMGFVFSVVTQVGISNHDHALVTVMAFAQLSLAIAGAVLFWTAAFSIRRSMLDYYNSIEPIQLRLSGVMTFFLSVFYLQYHMSRIARWKRTGLLTA